MGKSKCCCCPKIIPHLKFMNVTADSGFPIPNDEEQFLWRDVQSSEYCIFGPLKDCFDLTTGEFTVKETGLYAITVVPTFTMTDGIGCTGPFGPPIPSEGDRLVRVKRTYGSPRCNGTSIQEISFLGQSQVISTPSLIYQLMTFNAVQPLAEDDKLDFLAFQTNPDGFCALLFFEIHIVKLSHADINIFDPTMTSPPTENETGNLALI